MGKLKQKDRQPVGGSFRAWTLLFAGLKIFQAVGNLTLPWLAQYFQYQPSKILQTVGCNCGATSGVPVVAKALKVSMSYPTLLAIEHVVWINWFVELVLACILIWAARKNHVILMKLWTVVAYVSMVVELMLALVIPGVCALVFYVVAVLLLNGFGLWGVGKRIWMIQKSGTKASKKVAAAGGITSKETGNDVALNDVILVVDKDTKVLKQWMEEFSSRRQQREAK